MILAASIISLLSPLKYLLQKIVNKRFTGIIFNFIALIFCAFYTILNDSLGYHLMFFLSVVFIFSVDLRKKFNLESFILPFIFVDISLEYKSLILLVYFYISKNINIFNFLSIILITNNSLFISTYNIEIELVLLSLLFFNNLVLDKHTNIDGKRLIFTYILSEMFLVIQNVEALALMAFIVFSSFLYFRSSYTKKRELALYILPLSLYYLDGKNTYAFLLLILLSFNYHIKLPKNILIHARNLSLFLMLIVSFYMFVGYFDNYNLAYSVVLILYLTIFIKSMLLDLENTNKFAYKIITLFSIIIVGGSWR